MPYQPPPDLAALSLAEIAVLAEARKLPPIERWSPDQTEDSRMRIAGDGRWYHDGGEITRPAMVRAFASLLMCDADGAHWLVTPSARFSIEVEDAAFVAVDVRQVDDWLTFRLNTDDLVVAGPDHPLRAAGDPETPALYLAVRHGTEARLNRSTYLQLVDIAMINGDLSVSSQGAVFPLQPA